MRYMVQNDHESSYYSHLLRRGAGVLITSGQTPVSIKEGECTFNNPSFILWNKSFSIEAGCHWFQIVSKIKVGYINQVSFVRRISKHLFMPG